MSKSNTPFTDSLADHSPDNDPENLAVLRLVEREAPIYLAAWVTGQLEMTPGLQGLMESVEQLAQRVDPTNTEMALCEPLEEAALKAGLEDSALSDAVVRRREMTDAQYETLVKAAETVETVESGSLLTEAEQAQARAGFLVGLELGRRLGGAR